MVYGLHQFVAQSQFPEGPQDRNAGNVAVGQAVGLLFDLGKHIADHFPSHFGQVNNLWPGQIMVEIILKRVVFRQVLEVAMLNGLQVLDGGTANRDHLRFNKYIIFD